MSLWNMSIKTETCSLRTANVVVLKLFAVVYPMGHFTFFRVPHLDRSHTFAIKGQYLPP